MSGPSTDGVAGPTPITGGNPETGLVVLEKVTRTYPGGGVTALDGVSFRVGAGEFVAICGPSGSGKSTLLHLAGALDRPTSGRVEIFGHDLGGLPDRRLAAVRARWIGFVFQQFFLTAHLSALDNVADGLLYHGVNVAERRSRAREALQQVGLGHRLGHRPAQLSGGERQRVAVARAVVGRPPLLLADEPTGNLDSGSGEAVLGLLEDLNRLGTTVCVITHNEEVADALPRRVDLRDGRVVTDRTQLSRPPSPGVPVCPNVGPSSGRPPGPGGPPSPDRSSFSNGTASGATAPAGGEPDAAQD